MPKRISAIQVAAAAALDSPEEIIRDIRAVYKERRNVLIDVFHRAGWNVPSPPATMFAWARIPAPFADTKSLEFSELLLKEADIAVSPGIGFGEYGDDHVRLALVENEQLSAGRSQQAFMDAHLKEENRMSDKSASDWPVSERSAQLWQRVCCRAQCAPN